MYILVPILIYVAERTYSHFNESDDPVSVKKVSKKAYVYMYILVLNNLGNRIELIIFP